MTKIVRLKTKIPQPDVPAVGFRFRGLKNQFTINLPTKLPFRSRL